MPRKKETSHIIEKADYTTLERIVRPGDNPNDMTVVKANELIQKTRYDLSLVEQKIILRIIAMISPNETEFPLYEFSISEFASMCGIDSKSGKNYATIKARLKALADKSFYISLPGTDSVTLARWIEKPYINKGSGTVKIRLDNDLKPFLLQLKDYFTQFNISYTLPMRSQYSVRIYELCKSYENLHFFTIGVENLKQNLQCDGYKSWSDFRRSVMDVALNEINGKTDINISYKALKTNRSVTHIKIYIDSLEKKERQRVLDEINEKLQPRRLTEGLALADAKIMREAEDDDSPALPYIPTKSGTIEFAAGADPDRMMSELKLRADYTVIAKALTKTQKAALDTVIKIIVDMAGNTAKGQAVIDGGNKMTFLAINDVIIKYSGMQDWFIAAANKYDKFFETSQIKSPIPYLKKSIMEDLKYPEALISASGNMGTKVPPSDSIIGKAIRKAPVYKTK